MWPRALNLLSRVEDVNTFYLAEVNETNSMLSEKTKYLMTRKFSQ
jgi:hypothetical protein